MVCVCGVLFCHSLLNISLVGTNNVAKGWMDGNKGRGFSLENRNCQDSHSASWHISLNFQNMGFHLSKLEQLYSNTLHNIQNAGGSCHFIGRQQWREGERGGEILSWGFVNKILQFFRFFLTKSVRFIQNLSNLEYFYFWPKHKFCQIVKSKMDFFYNAKSIIIWVNELIF